MHISCSFTDTVIVDTALYSCADECGLSVRADRDWPLSLQVCIDLQNIFINPLTAGADHTRFLHFILAHYISAFKPVKDKKWH